MSKVINDAMHFTDGVNERHDQLWADTEILIGHGYHAGKDRFTLSYLDEEVFPRFRNTVPISGVQTLLEMAFGVQGPIILDSMYTKHGMGAPDEAAVPSYLVPVNENIEGSATLRESIYAPGHLVQLVGLGITGTAENNITKHKVGYRETDLEMTINSADGVLDCAMIPFRYTEAELDPNERQKYFGKKLDTSTGKVAYYYKRYESFPEIKHIWRSRDDNGKTSDILATNDTIWDYSRDDALKSLVEIHFTVTEDDVKEWFKFKWGQPESARFNTIALFTGRYTEQAKADGEQFGDYCNVRLFSKAVISTEPLDLAKNLDFIYRVYGS